MRKVKFAMNISIDGCYEHSSFTLDIQLIPYYTQLMLDTGVVVYGRKTYELMIPYWPQVTESTDHRPEDITFAKAMTPIPKIVLSRTLQTTDARIVRDDPEGLIRELKQQPGKKIALSSTGMLPQMLEAALLDELYLIVHPLLVGENKHLFNALSVKANFSLAKTQLFKSGGIALHYHKNE